MTIGKNPAIAMSKRKYTHTTTHKCECGNIITTKHDNIRPVRQQPTTLSMVNVQRKGRV